MYSMKRRTCPRPPETVGHVEQAVIVHPAFDQHVDLDGRQRRPGRGIDSLQHPGDWEADVVHGLEDVVLERVEADRHSPETGLAKGLSLWR